MVCGMLTVLGSGVVGERWCFVFFYDIGVVVLGDAICWWKGESGVHFA